MNNQNLASDTLETADVPQNVPEWAQHIVRPDDGSAVADTEPFDDHHATAEYRRTVGKRIFTRTVREALGLKEAA